MNLRQKLYQYCKDNDLEDLSCIIHFALASYISSHKSKSEWIYLSIEIINSHVGIGEEKAKELLEYLSTDSEYIQKSYELTCPNDDKSHSFGEDDYCETVDEDDMQDEDLEVSCNYCGQLHTIKEIVDYKIGFIANKDSLQSELKISNQDIVKEIVVLNTNSEHIDKMANIIVSRLNVASTQKEETKKGITKVLNSVKDVSGLIAGISDDVSSTTDSVTNIVKNLSGISILEDLIKN